MTRRIWTVALAALTILPASAAAQYVAHVRAVPVAAAPTLRLQGVPVPDAPTVRLHGVPIADARALQLDGGPALLEPATAPTSPAVHTILGATVGWVAGAGAGGLVGHAITDDDYDDWVGFLGAVVGAAVGGSIGTTVGAHLGNEKRGNVVATFLSTSAATALLLLAADRSSVNVPLVVVPVGQILTAVLVERATGRGS